MNNVSPVQTSLRYGLILGLVSILITVPLYITGLMTNPSISMISALIYLLVFVVVIVLAIRSHRNDKQGGFIKLGKAFLIGLLTSLFASILMFIFSYILYAVIDPDIIEAQLKMSEEMMENFGFMSDEQIETAMEDARSKATPLRSSLNQFGMVCCGAVVSLFAGLILKREPLDNENNMI